MPRDVQFSGTVEEQRSKEEDKDELHKSGEETAWGRKTFHHLPASRSLPEYEDDLVKKEYSDQIMTWTTATRPGTASSTLALREKVFGYNTTTDKLEIYIGGAWKTSANAFV